MNITDNAELETTAYFVVIEDDDFPVSMIDDLIRCYANARKINNICVISNFYDINNLMGLGKNLKKNSAFRI